MRYCNFNVSPRQVGKTTELLNNFVDCVTKGYDCYFITINSEMKDKIKRRLKNIPLSNLESISVSNLRSRILSILDIGFFYLDHLDYLFIDEYLLLDDILALYNKWDARGGQSGSDKYEDALYDCINELGDVIIKHEAILKKKPNEYQANYKHPKQTNIASDSINNSIIIYNDGLDY